jgi:sulfur-oxidizing protein SoxB
MRLHGKPIEADKKYRVAGWAPVSEDAKKAALEAKAAPIWDVVETWLKDKKTIRRPFVNLPRLKDVGHNPGRTAT